MHVYHFSCHNHVQLKKNWKTRSLKKRGDWKVATFYAGVSEIPFPSSFEDGMKQWRLIEVR